MQATVWLTRLPLAQGGPLVTPSGSLYHPALAAKYHRHVALPEPLARFLDRQVAEGRYASASEVVRAALRLLERQEDGARTTREAGADDE